MHMEPQCLVPPRLPVGQVVTRDLREPLSLGLDLESDRL